MFRTVVVLTIVLALQPAVRADDRRTEHSVEVSAEGVVDAAPDAFVLTAGIHARGKNLDQARKDASTASVQMTEVAKKFPIDRARTFTSSFMIRPIYHYETGEFLTFDVSQTIRFTVSDIHQAEAFTTEIIKAGATSIDSIEFVSQKTEELWEPARKKALESAREKAAGLAAVLNQKLGQPISIKSTENHDSTSAGCRWDPVNDATAAPSGPDKVHFVPPANIKIRATVQAEFALVDAK